VPVALIVLAALAGLSTLQDSPVRLLPTSFYGMTAAQGHEWDRAWLAWAAAGLAAAIAAGWFSRDPWRRMRHRHYLSQSPAENAQSTAMPTRC
jgi:hypothetical protein